LDSREDSDVSKLLFSVVSGRVTYDFYSDGGMKWAYEPAAQHDPDATWRHGPVSMQLEWSSKVLGVAWCVLDVDFQEAYAAYLAREIAT